MLQVPESCPTCKSTLTEIVDWYELPGVFVWGSLKARVDFRYSFCNICNRDIITDDQLAWNEAHKESVKRAFR